MSNQNTKELAQAYNTPEGRRESLLWEAINEEVYHPVFMQICKRCNYTPYNAPRTQALALVLTALAKANKCYCTDEIAYDVAELIGNDYDIQWEGGWLTW